MDHFGLLGYEMSISKTLLQYKTEHTGIQFIRYSLVGFVGLIVDYTFLLLLTEFCRIHYLFSAALAFLLGLVVNYLLSLIWVFNRRNLESKSLEFSVYAFFGALGLFINEGIICFFTEVFEYHYLISKLFYIVVYIFIFFLRKRLLFS